MAAPPRPGLPKPNAAAFTAGAGPTPGAVSAVSAGHEPAAPIALAASPLAELPRLPEVQGRPAAAAGARSPRSTDRGSTPTARLAQRAGASPASEQAVERALDWLARHQDGDGRWDGATARYDDGSPVKGDDDFTIHCPPGETCFGECLYWEADTALTGLSLLAYLGAGYTHTDGKYAPTVAKGVDFLLCSRSPTATSGAGAGPSACTATRWPPSRSARPTP